MKNGVFILILAAAAISSGAEAIVIRDDRSIEAAQSFAEWLPQPLVLALTADGAVNGMGTKIGDRFVVTAAHVAGQFSAGDMIGADATMQVADIHYAPDGPSMERDIAIIELESAFIGGDFVPLCNDTPGVGTRVAIIGAGDIGDGRRGVTGRGDGVLAAENTIDEQFPGVLSFLFDAPDDSAATYLEGVSGPGDSGGPAYVLEDGRHCVAGISSGQDTGDDGELEGRYGAREYYVDVAFHRQWIDAIPGLNDQ